MRIGAWLLVSLGSMAFAPVPLPKPDPTKTDLKNMQGEWVRIHYSVGGKLVAGVANSNIVIVNNHLRYGSTPGIDEWRITLDGRRKPKLFDIVSTSDQKRVYRGIYRLEKDRLTVYSRGGAAENLRPTDYVEKPEVYLEIFERRKR